MKILKRLNERNQFIFIMIAIMVFLLAFQTQASAQNQPRKYKPGDMVEMDGGEVYEIIRCNGDGEWDECEYQAYFNNKPSGNPNRMTIRNLRASEERLRLARERAAKSGSGTGNTNNSNNNDNRISSNTPPKSTVSPSMPKNNQKPADRDTVAGLDGKWKVGDKLEVNDRAFWYPSEIVAVQGGKYKVHFEGYPSSDDKWVDESRMRPIGGHQITAECSYDFSGDTSSQATASEQLFKKKIWQRYSFRSKKGGSPSVSAPDEIGAAFLTFQMGKAYTNTVSNVPGRGANRINNGAPVNATVYPVKTKYVICKKYPTGLERALHDESMACFKDKNGEWVCDGEGVPKITQLDQQ